MHLEETAVKPKLRDFIWDRSELKIARRLTICFLILTFQQLMSINFLVYYSTIIFRNNGLDANISAILGAVMNTVYWRRAFMHGSVPAKLLMPDSVVSSGTIPAIWLIESWGRRGLMLRTAIICTILMSCFIALIGLPADRQTLATNWAASALIIIYSWFFGLGWIAAGWQYAPGMFRCHRSVS